MPCNFVSPMFLPAFPQTVGSTWMTMILKYIACIGGPKNEICIYLDDMARAWKKTRLLHRPQTGAKEASTTIAWRLIYCNGIPSYTITRRYNTVSRYHSHMAEAMKTVLKRPCSTHFSGENTCFVCKRSASYYYSVVGPGLELVDRWVFHQD